MLATASEIEAIRAWDGKGAVTAHLAIEYDFGHGKVSPFVRVDLTQSNVSIVGVGQVQGFRSVPPELELSVISEVAEIASYEAELPPEFSVDFQRPLSVLSVHMEGVPLGDVFGVDNDGCKTLSLGSFGKLADMILLTGSEVLHELTQGSADAWIPPEVGVGNLTQGDLVGAAVVQVALPWEREPLVLPISPCAPLGVWGAAVPKTVTDSASVDILQAGSTDSSRRLSVWIKRVQRHQALGQFSEAVVALEAAAEQWLRFMIDVTMVEHGFKAAQIEAMAVATNARMLHSGLQAHFGGNAGEWRNAYHDSFKPLWELRNRAIHSAVELSHDDFINAIFWKREYCTAVGELITRSSTRHDLAKCVIDEGFEREVPKTLQNVLSELGHRDFRACNDLVQNSFEFHSHARIDLCSFESESPQIGAVEFA